MRTDVAVLGGGPAGAAAALTLARAGVGALLIDRSFPTAVRVGEALPPAARPLLADLRVLDLVRAGGHLECLGNVSVWGGPEPRVHDFLREPHGTGWHLDRARFDQALRRAAARAGAGAVEGARGVEAERAGAGWRLRWRNAGGAREEAVCAWLIDATGRRGAVARRRGAVRRRADRLVAFAARFRPAPGAAPDADARTWIEAAPDGWWYTARVPRGEGEDEPGSGRGGDPGRRRPDVERIVVFHTDADLAGAAGARTAAGLASRLADAPNLHALLAVHGYALAGRPRGVDAGSARLDPVAGDGWLAVGDAAVSFDPLSSQGLLNALYTGLRGAEAAAAALGGDASAPAAYAGRVREIDHAYLRHRAVYYAAERRWPTRPFWRRRQAAGSP